MIGSKILGREGYQVGTLVVEAGGGGVMCLTFWTLSRECRTLSSMKSGHSGGGYKVWKGIRFLSSHLRLHMHYIILTTASIEQNYQVHQGGVLEL